MYDGLADRLQQWGTDKISAEWKYIGESFENSNTKVSLDIDSRYTDPELIIVVENNGRYTTYPLGGKDIVDLLRKL